MSDPDPSLEPFTLRRDVRYACAGDGLCCTDVHLVGPLKDDEVVRLSVLSEDIVTEHDGDAVLIPRPRDGACVFLGDEMRCQLHATLGGQMKPTACHQYPFHLIATPSGGRLATDHRCPCRTMGERPELDLEASLAPFVLDGELIPNRAIEGPIAFDSTRSISFAEYEEIERWMIDTLLDDSIEEALSAEPFEALTDGRTFADVGRFLATSEGTTRHERAVGRFGDAMLRLAGERAEPGRALEWGGGFERAEKRSPVEGDPEQIFADYLADHLYSLYWAQRWSLKATRVELATRLLVGRVIAAELHEAGTRADRAAAEAVAVMELSVITDEWTEVIDAIAD